MVYKGDTVKIHKSAGYGQEIIATVLGEYRYSNGEVMIELVSQSGIIYRTYERHLEVVV